MSRRTIAIALASAAIIAGAPRSAAAAHLAVDVWLDQGDAAVYQQGQALGIRARVSEDAYLLVYEIDGEGYVNLLYPLAGHSGYADAHQELAIPPDDAKVDLVVQGPPGEGYVVAIASSERFRELPWYLRPYDAQASNTGYEGDTPPEDQDVTSDGQIVGDPFVAMEKIRRLVLADPNDETRFATSYTSYYIHDRVRYPRYLCDDCHRPSYWSWWPGYDPYFATCSAFDFRANWGWSWGPSYWTGCVPYYVFVPRPGCPPGVRGGPGITYSSWLGWNKWNALWGGRLRRSPSAAPKGYIGPDRFRDGRVAGQQGRFDPPGYVTAASTSPMLHGARGMMRGRLDDHGTGDAMLGAHGLGTVARPQFPTRGEDGARPQPGVGHGVTLVSRPTWHGPAPIHDANGRLQWPSRAGSRRNDGSSPIFGAPRRFDAPRMAAPPRTEAPRRAAAPGVRAPVVAPARPAPASQAHGDGGGKHGR